MTDPARRSGVKMMPFVFGIGVGALVVLTYTPWRPQTPWAMVCISVMCLGGMLLAHWDDNPSDGD